MSIRIVASRRAVPAPSIFDEVRRGLPAASAGDAAPFVPPIDVSETEGWLRFVAELPGVEKGDLEVVVDADVVTIRGEKKVARPEEGRRNARCERAGGRFSRSFRVPFDVEPAAVKGRYRHGILTVTVPKPAAQPPLSIPITTD